MKKESRLYFTDPIKAIFMTQNYGVKFEMVDYMDGTIKEANLGELLEYAQTFKKQFSDKNKIYVAKESEIIFKPKEGDQAIVKGRMGACYLKFKDNFWVGHGVSGGGKPEIILRDDKHFFSAKIEEL